MWNRKSNKRRKSLESCGPRPDKRFRFNFLGKIATIVVLALIWEAAAQLGLVGTVLLPAPHQILGAAVALFQQGTLGRDLLQSLHRVIVGFSAALILGVGLGLLSGVSRRLSLIFLPVVDVLRPIPPIAWVPVAILWFGLGDHSSYFIVFLGAFPPVFINAFAGVQAVEQRHVDVARCLGANRWRILREVIWPSALPFIMTGARIGSGVAWTSVIAAELVGAQDGLGYMIQMNRLMLQTDNLLVGMIIIGLAGALINFVLMRLQILLIPWKTETTISSSRR